MTAKQRFLMVVAIVLLIGAAGCVNSPDTASTGQVIAGDRPAMWHLADADSNIYLFGTFHLLLPDTEWQSARFDAAMLSTSTTYLEADTTSTQALAEVQQAVQQYGLNPPGVTLSSLLGEERTLMLADFATRFGVSMEQLEPLRPWLASLTLTVTAMQQLGLDVNAGADTVILDIAESQGDAVRYLESAVSQIEALATLDDLHDYTVYDDSVAQLEQFEDEIQSMLNAWTTGNERAMEQQMVASIKEVSQRAYDIFLVQRNVDWVRQITELMAGDGDYFVAVGAGHLVGEQSVVDLLRQRGFAVVRIQ